jgi:single-stranded-DNA-specific exonuclease
MCTALAQGLGVSLVTAAVLAARGSRSSLEARAVLFAEDSPGPDPFLIPDMERAVDRLHRAVARRERVVVYGDYDVDGASATSLYVGFLNSLGLSAGYYIPHRLTEGYGLNEPAIRRLASSGVTLLITADCGTTAHREIAVARSLSLDVIVTDHHLPEEVLPPALALLNPCRADSRYPFQGLCSGGLAYKVTKAYVEKYGPSGFDPDTQLDLVALATIADVAPLQAENRRMVRQGLGILSQGTRPGIRALKAIAGVEGLCRVGTVGFTLAPRLNAAGRLGDPTDAVRLLLTRDPQEAADLAQKLDLLNRERQRLEEAMITEAVQAAEESGSGPIVLGSRAWHPGVVGIVAGRLAERYHRPAVLIAIDGQGVGRGSARSIAGVNVYDAIAQCRSDLGAFGGHAVAAGLTVHEDRIAAFRERLREVLAETLPSGPANPLLSCDAEVDPAHCLAGAARELERLGPFGAGNPEPMLVIRRLQILSARVVGNNHLKLSLRNNGSGVLDAIGFRLGSLESHGLAPTDTVDFVGALEINAWNGTERAQFRLKDLRASARE